MNELPVDMRIQNFDEVKTGYTKEQAIEEASRCLHCENPTCITGCPVRINIKDFIAKIKEDNPDAALEIISKNSTLPGVCGRVCPQEKQCEAMCVLAKAEKQIAIGNLERYAADNGKTNIVKAEKTGRKVAIIGSGPGGLTCASELIINGVDVTIFEALHEAGGVLMYGIPDFRLPKKIVKQEVDRILSLGVELKLNHVVGKIISLKEIEEEYDAVFIANGAGLPGFLGVPGENLPSVISANEYLVRNNLMKAYRYPVYKTPVNKVSRVCIVGGGNVVVDASRVAKRLGADVSIIYRRTMLEMPERAEEVLHAQAEGIKIIELAEPVEFIESENATIMKYEKMKPGEPDESGRKHPEHTGEFFELETDEVIIAIGQKPNPMLAKEIKDVGIKSGVKGEIIVDDNMQTSNPKFFAGGDIIGGKTTVIKAMGNGRTAAKKILGN